MQHSLDNLVGSRIAPIITVFVHPRPNSRGGEFLGDDRLSYAQSLAEEIVPYIDANYRTIASREARASIGHGFAAYGALFTAFKMPAVFGKVASQSAFMLTSHRDVLYAVMPQAGEFPMAFYLECAKYDYRSPLEQWDARVRNMGLAEKLQGAGYDVNGVEVNEGFGYACWRNRTDKVLETLFPLAQ